MAELRRQPRLRALRQHRHLPAPEQDGAAVEPGPRHVGGPGRFGTIASIKARGGRLDHEPEDGWGMRAFSISDPDVTQAEVHDPVKAVGLVDRAGTPREPARTMRSRSPRPAQMAHARSLAATSSSMVRVDRYRFVSVNSNGISRQPRNVQMVRPLTVSPCSSTAGQGSVRICPVAGSTTSGCCGKGHHHPGAGVRVHDAHHAVEHGVSRGVGVIAVRELPARCSARTEAGASFLAAVLTVSVKSLAQRPPSISPVWHAPVNRSQFGGEK
ncbi:MAG: hypothetical protein MZV70_08000 [Desulfobacterales bacterium]|nr:hypothetical protein [Desulfobacterales bacterium]